MRDVHIGIQLVQVAYYCKCECKQLIGWCKASDQTGAPNATILKPIHNEHVYNKI